MKPGSMAFVQPLSNRPRAGNAYLLRGFIGIFSTGIDHLGEEVNAGGVRAMVYQDDQWHDLAEQIVKVYAGKTDCEPLILVGHSYGADDSVRIARVLDDHGIKVDLLVTIEPPPVPKNVVRAVDFYRPNGIWDAFPFFRGVPLTADPGARPPDNVNIRTDPRHLMYWYTDHFNIEKDERIHRAIIQEIQAICPDRPVWIAEHMGHTGEAAAPSAGAEGVAGTGTIVSGNDRPIAR